MFEEILIKIQIQLSHRFSTKYTKLSGLKSLICKLYKEKIKKKLDQKLVN